MERNMASPIKPRICETTGRVLTEWFEFPEYTEEQLHREACEEYGVDPDNPPVVSTMHDGLTNDVLLMSKVNSYKGRRKQTRWRGNMSQQEVQARMNEATKMIDLDNQKFLPDEVRERTGLEINPLWMMECLIRAGVLSPKDMMSGLKDLATYTHSKAPTISHSTQTKMNPEDWLVELAQEQYKTVDDAEVLTERPQPVERGSGPRFERSMKKKAAEVQALQDHADAELSALEELFDGDE